MSEAKQPTDETVVKRIDVTSHDEPTTDGVAKAVVITSRPILKAPTVSAATEGEAAPSVQTAPPLPVTGAKQQATKPIKPLVPGAEATSTSHEKPNNSPEPVKPATTAAKSNVAAPATTPAPADATASQSDQPAQDGKPANDSTSEDADTKDAAQSEEELNAEAEAQAKHDEAIQKLVDSKKYYLPINAVELRKTKHFVVLGVALSVFLLLAWADVALDAGLVQIPGVKPFTHFFSN